MESSLNHVYEILWGLPVKKSARNADSWPSDSTERRIVEERKRYTIMNQLGHQVSGAGDICLSLISNTTYIIRIIVPHKRTNAD